MSNFSLDYCIDEFMIYCRSRDLRRRTMDSSEELLQNLYISAIPRDLDGMADGPLDA